MAAASPKGPRKPSLKFFTDPPKFRAWLEKHHGAKTELIVGFYKRGSGRPSITWPEAVDQALCFGWIDGVRRSIDAESYCIRFTPRKTGSVWSGINTRRARALMAEGTMTPAGRRAFEHRREHRSGVYSYEQRSAALTASYGARLRKNAAAREFFESQAPWYRKAAAWFVVSAKKEETRRRRLEKLIAHSARGERLPEFRWTKPAR